MSVPRKAMRPGRGGVRPTMLRSGRRSCPRRCGRAGTRPRPRATSRRQSKGCGCRRSTSRRRGARSVIAGRRRRTPAEVHPLHVGVGPDLRGRALGEDCALVEHGDGSGHREDHVHVVLGEHHGEAGVAAMRATRARARRAPRGHARRRLVEQQQARRAGQRDAQLEPPLVAVREDPARLGRLLGAAPRARGAPSAARGRVAGARREQVIVPPVVATGTRSARSRTR